MMHRCLIAKFLHCRTDGKEWKRLIDAGINDWGGVSPVTKDWVNPEVFLKPYLSFIEQNVSRQGCILGADSDPRVIQEEVD
jgi:hypothetical protein